MSRPSLTVSLGRKVLKRGIKVILTLHTIDNDTDATPLGNAYCNRSNV